MSINRKQLSVSVDMDVSEFIKNMSKETRISRSVIVNDILADCLQKSFNFRQEKEGDLETTPNV